MAESSRPWFDCLTGMPQINAGRVQLSDKSGFGVTSDLLDSSDWSPRPIYATVAISLRNLLVDTIASMSLPHLLPIAGAAGSLAVNLVNKVSDGLPFSDVLKHTLGGAQGASSESSPAETPTTEIDQPLNRQLEQLQEVLLQRFKTEGVDVSHPLRLRDDGFGNVVVDGDHPDRGTVEDIFDRDHELRQLFFAALRSQPGVSSTESVIEIRGEKIKVLETTS